MGFHEDPQLRTCGVSRGLLDKKFGGLALVEKRGAFWSPRLSMGLGFIRI